MLVLNEVSGTTLNSLLLKTLNACDNGMCGIAGVFSLNQKEGIDKKVLVAMTEILKHRGPDGEGYYVDGRVGLGHRRLKIIDLSNKARQPMANEDETVWLVFNGEIYNFLELRKELEQKGHNFRSHSDTEVVVHAYEVWGENCVTHLRGMFAFAIWDRRQKKLFIARDRVGKKPLFYHRDADRFIFASELKALLLYPGIKRDISRQAIADYLGLGYIPAPATIFEQFKKLLPGHTMTVYSDGSCRLRQFWDLQFKPEQKSEDYWINGLLNHLDEAVAARMISDVPLGAFLSGGIDSSAVVAIMSRHSEQPVKTFSIGFEEAEFSELKHAKMISEKFGTDHHEFIVKPDAIEVLPKLVWHYNEPYGDSSALPTYYVANVTRKYVTVALNGDGGDESFAGYDRYAGNRLLFKTRMLSPMFTVAGALMTSVLPEPYYAKHPLRKARLFLQTSRYAHPADAYAHLCMQFDERARQRLLDGFAAEKSESVVSNAFLASGSKSIVSSMQYADIKRYLPDDLLVKMDIAAMANSLEARSPFLDHRLMEFAARIPPQLHLQGLQKKFLLKKALAKILPQEILRKRKQGFGIPLGAWFRQDLLNYSHDILLSQDAVRRGYFNTNEVKRLLEQHKFGRVNNGYKLWSLLWLELWHRVYVDDEMPNVRNVSA